MRKVKYLFVLFLMLGFAAIVVGCKPKDVLVTSIELSGKSTMLTGEEQTLTVKVLPDDATLKDVEWLSDNAEIATVTNGKVKALKEGTVKITALAKDESGKKGELQITITNPTVLVTSVTLEGKNAMLTGEEQTLIAEVLPENASLKDVNWSSSNEEIATVVEGKVKALKEGTVTITAIAKDESGKKGELQITITNPIILVTSVIVNGNSEMVIDEEQNLEVKVLPENANLLDVTWSSSNEEIATVVDGKVKALKEGTVTITATAKDKSGKKGELQITVVKPEVADPKDVIYAPESSTYDGRVFNQDFDKLISNFTQTDLDIDGKAYVPDQSYLHVVYNKEVGTTKDNPIYKGATAANTEGSYAYLVFVMRTTTNASLNDLVLSFRYNDSYEDIDVKFTDLVSGNEAAFPALSSTYQVYIIDIINTLDGHKWNLIGGTEADQIDTSSSIVGFHLLANQQSNINHSLDIAEVYFTNSESTVGATANDSLLDNFNREIVNKAAPGAYWNGSCGVIINQDLVFDGEGTYKFVNAEEISEGYLVLRLRGNAGGEDFYIAKVDSEGVVGEYKLFSSLKANADSLDMPSITQGFQCFTINLEASELKGAYGYSIKSLDDKMIFVDSVYLSNLEEKQVEAKYPVLSTNILLFDDFNRNEAGVSQGYDAENPVALAHGFNYILTYAETAVFSMNEGCLVTTPSLGSLGYTQYGVACDTRGNNGSYQYLVLKVKTTDGATLDNFRMQTSFSGKTSETIWYNQLYSAEGLKVATEGQVDYSYYRGGFTYLIVDLEESNLINGTSGLTQIDGFYFFFGGEGSLVIDAIFWANQQENYDMDTMIIYDDFNIATFEENDNWWKNTAGSVTLEYNSETLQGALVMDTKDGYTQYRTASPINNGDYGYPYMVLSMKGKDASTLETFRIALGENDPVYANTNKLILSNGKSINSRPLTNEYQTYVIDLVASGLSVKELIVDMYYGGWGDNDTCLYVDYIGFVDKVSEFDWDKEIVFDDFNIATFEENDNWWKNTAGSVTLEYDAETKQGALVMDTKDGYTQYRTASPINNGDYGYKYMVLVLKGKDASTLESFRIALGENDPVYANANKLILANGESMLTQVLTNNYQTYIIDLVASGLSVKELIVDMYYGGWGDNDTCLYVDSISFVDKVSNINFDEEIVFDDFNIATFEENDNWWKNTAGSVTLEYDAETKQGALVMDTKDGYTQYRTASPVNNSDYGYKYMVLVLKGKDTSTLESFRIALGENDPVYANANKLILANGESILTQVLTNDYQTYVIDLVASGLSVKELIVDMYYGGWGDNDTCLYVDSIGFVGVKNNMTAIEGKLAFPVE